MAIDSSGTQCMSPNTTSSPLSKIKYRDGEILNQGGTKLIVQTGGSNIMTLESPYFGGGSYQFFRDDDLEKAAIECQEAMANLDATIQ
ncbi:hypothetical protein [Marinobacter metalliresistant]|uniref:Uncharacterized protein n=1 Tax=Marinobacter metalliresistant TaxID=2961995 RepID=A0ABZ2W2A5_9GAMM